MSEMKRLVAADAAPIAWSGRSLHRIWPDFPMQLQVDASCVTVKADAARRAFNASANGIVWAVVDSGIGGDAPALRRAPDPRHPESAACTGPSLATAARTALVDERPRTHVAGIIAGCRRGWWTATPGGGPDATESCYNVEKPREPLPRAAPGPRPGRGWPGWPRRRGWSASRCCAGGTPTRVGRVIRALAYVARSTARARRMRIHGVNLSLGYEFDPQWFACGRSPLCKEVDKLVRSASSSWSRPATPATARWSGRSPTADQFGLGMTINDPGNAERAITVGSTHRDAPHGYGVSYFSSKGPTGDGRAKPDLVAPGERITPRGRRVPRRGGGRRAATTPPSTSRTPAPAWPRRTSPVRSRRSSRCGGSSSAARTRSSGSSWIGDPLGRGRFPGAGLLDLMRALQSI